MRDTNYIIGRNIQRFLDTQKLKQADLGTELQLPRQTISKMIHGQRMITAPELIKISSFLGIKIEELFNEKSEPQISAEPVLALMGQVNTTEAKNGIEMLDEVMDLISFHRKTIFAAQAFSEVVE